MASNETPESNGGEGASGRTRKAGAFDMRNFIAGLIGIYGVALVVYGLVGNSDAELAKADGLNINLWAGIGMVVVSASFVLWARLRPVVVPGHTDEHD